MTPAPYRVVIEGLPQKPMRSYPHAYRVAQDLADRHACKVYIQKDYGRLGWMVCEYCEPRRGGRSG